MHYLFVIIFVVVCALCWNGDRRSAASSKAYQDILARSIDIPKEIRGGWIFQSKSMDDSATATRCPILIISVDEKTLFLENKVRHVGRVTSAPGPLGSSTYTLHLLEEGIPEISFSVAPQGFLYSLSRDGFCIMPENGKAALYLGTHTITKVE